MNLPYRGGKVFWLIERFYKISDASLSGDLTIDPIDGLTKIEKSVKGKVVEKEPLIDKIGSTLEKYEAPGVEAEHFADLILSAYSQKKE